ncbi:hypothetical protein GOV11_04295 [Candidatus Woesearchaeota archaeon]|nr:hypothetical protein [Candidatus Woesearchaeota archaeon]
MTVEHISTCVNLFDMSLHKTITELEQEVAALKEQLEEAKVYKPQPVKAYAERTENGWTLKANDGETETSLSYGAEDQSEVQLFCSLLNDLDYLVGPSTGRYSPQRIVIKVESGDKHSSYVEPQNYDVDFHDPKPSH